MEVKSDSLQEWLSSYIEESSNQLEKYALDYLLKNFEDDHQRQNFINEVLNYGCQSGIVSELIYYKDTHHFYDRFYLEIETIRRRYENMTGSPIHVKGDLKNFYAWFGFEQAIQQIQFLID